MARGNNETQRNETMLFNTTMLDDIFDILDQHEANECGWAQKPLLFSDLVKALRGGFLSGAYYSPKSGRRYCVRRDFDTQLEDAGFTFVQDGRCLRIENMA
jgi:hypothetical protein